MPKVEVKGTSWVFALQLGRGSLGGAPKHVKACALDFTWLDAIQSPIDSVHYCCLLKTPVPRCQIGDALIDS